MELGGRQTVTKSHELLPLKVAVSVLCDGRYWFFRGWRYPPGWAGTVATSALLMHQGVLTPSQLGELIRAAANEAQIATELSGPEAEKLMLQSIGLRSGRQVANRYANVSVELDQDLVVVAPTSAQGSGWRFLSDQLPQHLYQPSTEKLGSAVVGMFENCRPRITLP
jgi:hypothetical protein